MPSADPPKPRFFRSQAAFRAWLEARHASASALLVGFHKQASGKGGITYPQALDEALCFGWIDGIRRSHDSASYTVRFTPRKPGSTWSLVNLRKIEALQKRGLVRPPGEAALAARDRSRSGTYSFENRPQALDPAAERALRADRRAHAWFLAQTPWYRRTTAFWVASAKKPETRAARLAALIACCAEGKPIPPLRWAKQFRKPAD